jgi:L-2-hydroxycarboxylate dehydrogenase (NAD+)
LAEEYRRYKADGLLAFTAAILVKAGVPEEDARLGAWALIHADLMGVDSHGIAHLATSKGYVPGLQAGIVNPRANMRITHETPSTALFDADHGLGIVAASRAMEVAIDKAQRVGCGFVAIANSRHCGMTAHYAMMALAHDMIGLAMTNTIPSVAPAGGLERRLGTNPIAVAVPADKEPPFVLDIATSVVAAGKLELARLRGAEIPEGWAIDQDGNPSTDPFVIRKGGMLLPLGSTPQMGSHKGYGLGMMVDIFSGVLSGMGTCRMLNLDTYEMGHFVGAWRIDAFRPAAEFKAMMDEFIRDMHSTKAAPGFKQVMVAGEREYYTERERRENGIPLHPKVVEPLQQLGDALGVTFPG